MLNTKCLPGLLLAICAGGLLGADHPPGGPTPSAAIHRLVDGNMRYILGAPAGPRRDAGRREEVARGQRPFAAVLSCADSRVPAEVVFDQGLGDLFSVRVAGNVADVTEIASLEYAVEHLHVPVIVVLGHTKCGAVTAAVGKAGGTAGELPPHIDQLVSHITPAVAEARAAGAAGEALAAASVKRNVFHTMGELLARSAIVREAVGAGHVKLVGGVYDLESGKVDFSGEHPAQKTLLAAGHPPAQPVHHAVSHVPAPSAPHDVAQANRPEHVSTSAGGQTLSHDAPPASRGHATPVRQEADARPAPSSPRGH